MIAPQEPIQLQQVPALPVTNATEPSIPPTTGKPLTVQEVLGLMRQASARRAAQSKNLWEKQLRELDLACEEEYE
jgi:hypothetical protein